MTSEEIEIVAKLLAAKLSLSPEQAMSVVADAVRDATGQDPAYVIRYPTLYQANLARQQEYDPESKTGLLFWSNALAGEMGELCNIVKKLEREALGLPGKRATHEELAMEVADIHIYLDLFCQTAKVNVADVIQRKFNETSEKLGFKTRLG